jgi:hypothetical protein
MEMEIKKMNIKQYVAAFGFAWIMALGSLSGTATAMTPDGETPANEGVCNELQGGTPALYGLCVAYCEAQDLDIVGDKETPNNKILANYNKKKQSTDPDMPCIQTPCPCWTQEELDAISVPIDCVTDSTTGVIRSTSQFASVDTSRPICRFTDRNTSPRISRRFSGDAVPAAAAQTCLTQITNACAAHGF